ncbi:histone-lysine N-methyltransferase, H3 lysine-9 specific SUVH4 [Selaginella moellendorffii]|uniref:histone-lysine N-methyltransferase, H3 lysine-9 specific SUVH4 n=1 Tax=Selaginella moellendorffii TaxID=88036 RepID=UPI000D1C4120|nr:histone-lysine N-methyltransferase, H3 lysine-9 specific SUVH4 [Selaginella moellendorffii]|eukprot:XP_024522726.1 histone-lysine N-methyltransferase, H3 lysine-9 specific SUVH4 [Selaginella moellendorffii]
MPRTSKNVDHKRRAEVLVGNRRAMRLKTTGMSADLADLAKVGAEGEVDVENGQALSKSGNFVLGDAAKVKNNLRIFNMCYLQAIKEEQERCKKMRNASQRPDLKAISKMLRMNAILFPEKRIGDLPGVKVGDTFFSRAELVSVGIHKHWINGIDYIGKGDNDHKTYNLPLAISIVMSGGYEDDVDNSDDVIYTGQGGNNLAGDRRQMKHQEMKRGNLALKNSIEEGNPVRVFRGHDLRHSYTKRVYTYDGLYKVVDYWAERGISGFKVYKFKLRRCEGQPALTTEQVRFCRGKLPVAPSERGLVCKDISNGLEVLPVPVSNLVDNPPCAPDGYRYINKIEIDDGIVLPPPALGCSCKGLCVDPKTCSCAKRNGHTFPYVDSHGGRLAVPLDAVYECGPNCGCGPACINRVTQRGLRYRLEVYKTQHKGWAVRSWDSIPAGAPVCEYFGKVIKSDSLDVKSDVYLFDLDCIQTMRGVDGRQRRWGDLNKFLDYQNGKVSCESRDAEDAEHHGQAEFCLDGGECGAVARFINHSCEPNLFIQCVLSTHHDMRIPRIVLFAADNIAPLQELSYDYGYALNSVVDSDGLVKKLPCYCGALSCRKRLY